MDRFAPIPAEEYSDSDDELMFALSDQTQDHRIANNSIGSDVGSKPISSQPAQGPPKSKIPISSPLNNGVNWEDFRFSIVRGNVAAAQKAIEKGVDVNMCFRTGWTSLMYASHQVNVSLVTLLLRHGANPNFGQTTPLMACCTSDVMNREEDVKACISLLADAGADVNSTDQYSITPLMMACKRGHAGAAEILIEKGANIDQAENKGFTALAYACKGGQLSCVKALVQRGADVNVKTLEGQSLLTLAQSSRHGQQISSYISSLDGYHGADRNHGGDASWSAAINGTDDSELITNGSDTSVQSGLQEPPQSSISVHKFGDIEVFLYGLELSSLIPRFREHNITMEHLLIITDDELIKMGVRSVGQRKKILDSVHEMHKSDWQPSSIPAYDKVRSSKQLSPAEVTAMVASIASHSACLSATMKYIRFQIASNPTLLQVDKNGQGLHALRVFLHEANVNTALQAESCSLLRHQIEQTLSSGEADTVDCVTQEVNGASSCGFVVVTSTLVSAGVISLAALVYLKKLKIF